MTTFIAAIIVFALAMLGLALGLIMRGRSLRRGCGGDDADCDRGDCARPCPRRTSRSVEQDDNQ